MRRLLSVELTRLRWRRAVVFLLLLAVVIPALICATRIWQTRPTSESELESLRQESAGQISDCVAHPRRYGVPRSHAEAGCEEMVIGWQIRQPLGLRNERLGGPGIAVVAVLSALLLIAGATFAGHDWNSGSMSNQLLFESRRGRIWTAKALAVTIAAFVTAAVVSTAFWLTLWAVMKARDLTVVDGALSHSLAYGLRGAGFAAAAALGGYALTMLMRSTVGTVGVLFAVTVAGGILIATLGLSERWEPSKNVSAIVKDGTTYYVDVPPRCYQEESAEPPAEGSECDQQRELTLAGGAAPYGVALVLTMGASVVAFRRRDVP